MANLKVCNLGWSIYVDTDMLNTFGVCTKTLLQADTLSPDTNQVFAIALKQTCQIGPKWSDFEKLYLLSPAMFVTCAIMTLTDSS